MDIRTASGEAAAECSRIAVVVRSAAAVGQAAHSTAREDSSPETACTLVTAYSQSLGYAPVRSGMTPSDGPRVGTENRAASQEIVGIECLPPQVGPQVAMTVAR